MNKVYQHYLILELAKILNAQTLFTDSTDLKDTIWSKTVYEDRWKELHLARIAIAFLQHIPNQKALMGFKGLIRLRILSRELGIVKARAAVKFFKKLSQIEYQSLMEMEI